MKLLKKIDENLFNLRAIANLLQFEIDFTDKNLQKKSKIKLMNYLDKCYLEQTSKINNELISKILPNSLEEKCINSIKKSVNLFEKINSKTLMEYETSLNFLYSKYLEAYSEKKFQYVVKPLENHLNNLTKIIDSNNRNTTNRYKFFFNKYFVDIDFNDFYNSCKLLLEQLSINNKSKPSEIEINYKKNNLNENDVYKILECMGLNIDTITIKRDSFNSMLPISTRDIRLTLDFESDQKLFLKAIIHEASHIMYIQNISTKIKYFELQQPTALYFDEAFAKILDDFVFESTDFKEFLFDNYHIAKSENYHKDLLRIKSTNVYFLIHCLIRFILEVKLINGELEVNNLDVEYNLLIKDYLNLEVDNDNDGILQDPHWFKGDFMYYANYILSYFYAFFLHEKLVVENKIIIKKFTDIVNISKLFESFFIFGKTKSPNEIIKKILKKDFSFIEIIDFFQKNSHKKI